MEEILETRVLILKAWKRSEIVAPSCLTLSDPVFCNPPGAPVLGISQVRILEWVVNPFSRGSSWPRGWIGVSCVASRLFTAWTTRAAWRIMNIRGKQHWCNSSGWWVWKGFVNCKAVYRCYVAVIFRMLVEARSQHQLGVGGRQWVCPVAIELNLYQVTSPILWPPDAKSWLIGKDHGVGKNWRQTERMRWLDGTTNSVGMNLSKLWETVKDRGAWRAVVHGVTKSRTGLIDWSATHHKLLNASLQSMHNNMV